MKTKQKKDLLLKSTNELNALVLEAKSALSDLLLMKVQNKIKNLRQIFTKRKEIAQILTIIKNKELQREMEARNEKTTK